MHIYITGAHPQTRFNIFKRQRIFCTIQMLYIIHRIQNSNTSMYINDNVHPHTHKLIKRIPNTSPSSDHASTNLHLRSEHVLIYIYIYIYIYAYIYIIFIVSSSDVSYLSEIATEYAVVAQYLIQPSKSLYTKYSTRIFWSLYWDGLSSSLYAISYIFHMQNIRQLISPSQSRILKQTKNRLRTVQWLRWSNTKERILAS